MKKKGKKKEGNCSAAPRGEEKKKGEGGIDEPTVRPFEWPTDRKN